jgi:HEAT repeat protein
MPHPSLQQITEQLNSQESSDRLLALLALRDWPTAEAFPLIKQVLDDSSMPVRTMAIRSLAIHVTPESLPLLLKLLADREYEVRAGAAGALGCLGDHRALQPLMQVFHEDTHWLVRFSAVVSLGNLHDPQAKDFLITVLTSPEVLIQQAAIAALGEIGVIETLNVLLPFIDSEDWLTRLNLAQALGNLPSDKSISALKYLTKDDHPQVCEAATRALEQHQP